MIPTVVVLAVIVLALLWDRRTERQEWIVERAGLLQRIQAPEAAIVHHAQQGLVEHPPVLEWDNDEQFHETREDLAEALRRADR